MAAGAASLLALYILSGVVERIDALPGVSPPCPTVPGIWVPSHAWQPASLPAVDLVKLHALLSAVDEWPHKAHLETQAASLHSPDRSAPSSS